MTGECVIVRDGKRLPGRFPTHEAAERFIREQSWKGATVKPA